MEIQLHPSNPGTSPQQTISSNALSPKILTLPQDDSLPSIIASEEEVGGVIIRPVGSGEHWSKVYPLMCGSHTCNRPQLLAEVRSHMLLSAPILKPCFLNLIALLNVPLICVVVQFPGENGSRCHCWYNVKPMDYQDNKPWGGKVSQQFNNSTRLEVISLHVCIHLTSPQITLSPLFAVSNHTPFDVTIVLEKDQPDPDSTSSAPPTSPDSSYLAPSGFPHIHSKTLTLSKGETHTLSSEYAADVSYNLKLRTK